MYTSIDKNTPMVIASKEGIILETNEAVEKHLGYKPETLTGKHIESVLKNIDLNACFSEVTINCSSGSRLCLLAVVSTVVDNNYNIVKYIVSFTDVEKLPTMAKRIAEERAKVGATKAELQMFVSCISHDLRSPLVSIEGFIVELEELLNDMREHTSTTCEQNKECKKTFDDIFDNMNEAIGFVDTSVTRLKRLVNIVVDLHKNSERKLNNKPIDIKSILNMLISSMQHQIDKANCIIRINAQMPHLNADSSVIERIFANILDNAIKYLDPSRPGQIDIDYYIKDQKVIFTIKDNGIGISENSRKYVFQPFRRATDREIPGDGVGMPMVKSLIDLYNGEIWFNSKEQRGTTFYLSFPTAMLA
jgi:PAS domain S-box-containing protein